MIIFDDAILTTLVMKCQILRLWEDVYNWKTWKYEIMTSFKATSEFTKRDWENFRKSSAWIVSLSIATSRALDLPSAMCEWSMHCCILRKERKIEKWLDDFKYKLEPQIFPISFESNIRLEE
jgi:uncharacterized ferredoxin-like protein